MALILLVRHGQASYGGADYDVLSELGGRQAELVGTALAGRGLRDPLVVHGSLRRQTDTARRLAGVAGFELAAAADPRWNEYDHVELGRGPGGEAPELERHLDVALVQWIEAAEPGGWTAFLTAARGALDSAADLARGRDVVAVTSGGVIAALTGALLGLPAAGVAAVNRTALNAAVTTVLAGRSGLNLVSLNEHGHFGGRRDLLTYV